MKLLLKSFPIYTILLIVFTLVETLCCTYLLENGNRIDIVAITYFIAGLGIAIIPMIPIKEKIKPPSSNKFTFRFNRILLYSFFAFIVIYFIFFMTGIMQNHVLDHRFSDTLPQIKVMCNRLLSGEKIYAPIPEIWDGKQPPYMPLMWLPFTAAEYLGIDIRWTTTLFLLGGIFLTFKILPRNYAGNPFILISVFISLFFLLNFLLVKDRVTLGNTEEGIVIGYYLLLGFALAKKKPILIGIAIACCLMSRFALFFWVPMYLLYVFFYESRKNAYIITSVVAVIILFVFLIPFGFKQPEYFINIPADYKVGVDQAWNYNYNEVSGKYYENSLGYTKYFDITDIHFLHNFQIIVAAILPFLCLLLFKLLKNKLKLNQHFFSLCSLKLTLVFFYNMIEVPYYYLFFVSTFFSYSILFAYLKSGSATIDDIPVAAKLNDNNL